MSQSRTNASASTTHTLTSPGVKVPPPVFYALAVVVSWSAQRLLPLPALPDVTAHWTGAIIGGAGVLLGGVGVATLLRGRGTLNTDAPSQELVTSGVYRISRNPLYVALALMYSGATLALNQPWALLLLPFLMIYTQVMVIAREEAFLASAFGQQYANYAARVRRWL